MRARDFESLAPFSLGRRAGDEGIGYAAMII
jgi:hypothetical protein